MILLAQERRWPGITTPNGKVMESPSTIPSWEALQTRLRQCLNWLRLFREWCAVLGGAVSANGYLTSTYTKANFLGIYFLFRGLLSHIARAVYLKRTISFLCSLGNHGTVDGWAGPWKAGFLGLILILIFSCLANLRLWMIISWSALWRNNHITVKRIVKLSDSSLKENTHDSFHVGKLFVWRLLLLDNKKEKSAYFW